MKSNSSSANQNKDDINDIRRYRQYYRQTGDIQWLDAIEVIKNGGRHRPPELLALTRKVARLNNELTLKQISEKLGVTLTLVNRITKCCHKSIPEPRARQLLQKIQTLETQTA